MFALNSENPWPRTLAAPDEPRAISAWVIRLERGRGQARETGVGRASHPGKQAERQVGRRVSFLARLALLAAMLVLFEAGEDVGDLDAGVGPVGGILVVLAVVP